MLQRMPSKLLKLIINVPIAWNFSETLFINYSIFVPLPNSFACVTGRKSQEHNVNASSDLEQNCIYKCLIRRFSDVF